MARPPKLPAPGAIKGDLPATQAPQLCSLVTKAPDAEDWLVEVKFDGYRVIASIDNGRVRLLTRKGLDWADRLPIVASAFAKLNVTTTMIDGELVALRPDGISSFSDLQAALSSGADKTLHFYAFDLLHLNGWYLRPCSLIDRKAALEKISGWERIIQFSSHHAGQAAEMYASACTMNLRELFAKPERSLPGWPRRIVGNGEVRPAGGNDRGGLDATSRKPDRTRCLASCLLRPNRVAAIRGRRQHGLQ